MNNVIPMPRRVIVKVQLSIPNRDRVLIYDEKRSFLFEGVASKEILELVGPHRWKAYFHARKVGKQVEIDGEEEDLDF